LCGHEAASVLRQGAGGFFATAGVVNPRKASGRRQMAGDRPQTAVREVKRAGARPEAMAVPCRARLVQHFFAIDKIAPKAFE